MALGNYQDHDKVSAIRYEQPKLSRRNPIEFEPKGLWTPKVTVEDFIWWGSVLMFLGGIVGACLPH